MPTPTQQGPSKVEAVKEVIGAVKDTAKELIQEARKTAETLNKEESLKEEESKYDKIAKAVMNLPKRHRILKQD
jgi:arsenate reductase-like glutaredoxin family protein